MGKDFGATAKSVTKTCNLANLAYLATQTANDTNADALWTNQTEDSGFIQIGSI